MQKKLDYKKEYPDLYMPSKSPSILEVPPMPFILVDGKGNPNDADGEYSQALQLLYALSYTIKFSKMGKNIPAGYFEYSVPPLEGLWELEGQAGFDSTQKDRFIWTSMIRQPEFVTEEVFRWACEQVQAKKPELDVRKARFGVFEEGLCVQVMHLGPYDEEPQTLARMEQFIQERDLQEDIGAVLSDNSVRRHHEIYLGDPRKTKPERLKTVLRHPVRRKERV